MNQDPLLAATPRFRAPAPAARHSRLTFLKSGLTVVLVSLMVSAARADKVQDQFDLAYGLVAKKEYALAAAELDALLAKHPDHKERDVALYWLGQSRQEIGETEAAIEAYTQLVERYPGSERLPRAHYSLAQLLDNPAQAAANYEAIVEHWPDDQLAESAGYGLAESLFKAELWDKALKAAQQQERRYPESERMATLLYIRGWAAFRLDQWREAWQGFDKLARRYPDDDLCPEAQLKAAQALRQLDQDSDALKIFSELSERDDGIGADAALGRAALLFKLGRMQEAARQFDSAAERLADDPRQAAARINAGQAWIAVSNYPAAIQTLERLQALRPVSALAPAAGYWRAWALFKSEKYQETAAALEPLIEEDTLQERYGFELRNLLAEVNSRLGNYMEAARAYENAYSYKQDHPQAAAALATAALLWEREGEWDAAAKDAALFIDNHPQHLRYAEMRLLQGELAFRQDSFEAAAKMFAKFIDDLPTDALIPTAYYKLGRAASHLGNDNEAFESFTELYRKFPESALAGEAAYRAGRAAERLGRLKEALGAYVTSIAIAPEGKDARQARLGEISMLLSQGLSEAARDKAAEFIRNQTDPELAPYALYYQAQALQRLDKPAEALELFGDSSLAQHEKLSNAVLMGSAAALRALGRHDEALKILRPIAELGSPSRHTPQAIYDQAWNLLELGRTTEAAERFTVFVTKFKDHTLASDAWFRLGELAYARQDFQAAADSYESALMDKRLRFAADVRYKLGWSYEQLDENEKALAVYARLLQDERGGKYTDEVSYRQALIQFNAKKYRVAISMADKVGEGAFSERSQLLKAEALRLSNQGPAALAAYNELLEKLPEGDDRLTVMLGRAHVLRAAGAHRDALEAYGQVIAATRRIEAAQATLGQGYCYQAMEMWDEAAKAFLKVDVLYGYDDLKPEALGQLARVWEKAGDSEKAERYRQERKKRYPDAQD